MSTGRRKQQVSIGSLVVGVLVAGFIILGVLMGGQEPTTLTGAGNIGFDETIIADRTAAASPEMSWITTSRDEIAVLKIQLEEVTKVANATRLEALSQVDILTEQYDDQIISQQAQINQLKEELVNVQSKNGVVQPVPTDSFGTDFITTGGQRRAVPGTNQPSLAIDGTVVAPNFGQQFNLAPNGGTSTNIKNLENYVPAGSYAPAIVLSGVDASTGVVSRDNPVPVLFRITAPAVTAGYSSLSGLKVDLTGCTVTGSATGDLSAERVYVRLIQMSCIGAGNTIIETDIAGYMVGSGKAGVRGEVVSREGSLVTNAAIAGTLQGLAGAVSSLQNSESDTEGGAAGIARQLGIGSLAGGAETAAGTLAEYYIRRAEQYQPVVSLYGGTKVELVFMEGVELL